jgi:hypothetical protein
MIHFCKILNLYQFDQPHHNLNKSNQKLTYNQLFVDDLLHLLNTKSGKLYTNSIDLDKVELLKLYNFNPDSGGRFHTHKDGQTTYIHELVFGVKTNNNYVINHIDGDPSNNKLTNLEVVTNWFNTVLRKKSSGLPIGAIYNNGSSSYRTQIHMPRNSERINFGSEDMNYLQNLHYQFGVKSGLVSPERYLKEVHNWLPDSTIQFKPEHQIKLDQLIATHIENQLTWDKPIMF